MKGNLGKGRSRGIARHSFRYEDYYYRISTDNLQCAFAAGRWPQRVFPANTKAVNTPPVQPHVNMAGAERLAAPL